jgi:FdhD protein
MALPPIYQNREIVRYKQGVMQPENAMVVNEIPLTVFLNDTELATLVCTPETTRNWLWGFYSARGFCKIRLI